MTEPTHPASATARSAHYLLRLLRFAFARNPLMYAGSIIVAMSLVAELVAMGSVYYASLIVSGQKIPAGDRLPTVLLAIGIRPDMKNLLVLFALVLLARLITQLGSHMLSNHIGKCVQTQLSAIAFDRIIRDFSLKEIEDKSIGYYITLTGDESARAGSVVENLGQWLSAAALAGVYFLAIAWYSPAACLMVSCLLCLSLLILLRAFRATDRLGARRTELQGEAGSILLDSLNGVRSVRAFSGEHYVSLAHRAAIHSYTRVLFTIDAINTMARSAPAACLLALFAVVMLIWAPADGSVDLAFAATLLFLLLRFFPVIGQCLNVSLRIVADAKAGRDMTGLLDEPAGGWDGSTVLGRPVTEIALTGVGFSYPGRAPVLDGVSIALRAGRSYAIVGPSGCGKSTLLDLLLGLRRVDAGSISINGMPIERVSLRSLRERVVLLGQQTTIFNDTVMTNISFGATTTDARVRAAAEAACIAPFIAALPAGYDTRLNYQGANLSGGQRQRIGIARALVREADVLILDEATASLDRETRDALVERILGSYHNRIVIFVTHDPWIRARVDEVIDLAGLNRVQPDAHAPATPSETEPA